MHLEFLPVVILVLNTVFAVTIVFFERRNPTAALAWLVVLFTKEAGRRPPTLVGG